MYLFMCILKALPICYSFTNILCHICAIHTPTPCYTHPHYSIIYINTGVFLS